MPKRFSSLALLVLAIPVSGDADDAPTSQRLALFDGTTLDRWAASGSPFAVEERAVLLKGGVGFLRAHHRFADFVLELKWRARSPEVRGAVCFRSPLPAPGQYLPNRYLINLQPGWEGALEGTGLGAKPELIQPGVWNEMRLRVLGSTAALEINGQHVWTFDGLAEPSGWLGLYADASCGGPLEFKDVAVTEIGFRSLANGTDLTGWEGAGSDAALCWKVEDGLLMCTGRKGPWLRSCEEFDDFNLRLEYKLRPGGNSGVYLRVPASGNHHGEGAGIEIQVLDDAADRYKSLKAYQYTGSLYAIVPAEPRVARPAGEWNTMEINCRGTHYRVTHNGVDVIAADEGTAAELKQRLVKGYLGLQNHSEEVWFRNLRIGPAE
ncbi:MAG: DUF1080 domain-containing protein [Candidatus Anammoximicrobium sp.]|nr:DUF1080 domain-containing protein [Candidatus Anammoximicrobium sp.]